MKRILYLTLTAVLAALTSCGGGKKEEVEQTDTIPAIDPDTLIVEIPEEEDEEMLENEHIDMTFDDFLYAFTSSRKMQRERTILPLRLVDINNNEVELEEFDCKAEFSFLTGEYYTMLYTNPEDIERVKDMQDSIVHIELINLNARRVRSYEFQHRTEGWRFTSIRDHGFDETGYGDFLDFYAKFSSDTTFQNANVAQPIRITMLDPEMEEQIDGTIDADQWPSFAPEIPQGTLTNIRRGQHYDKFRMVLQKCGVSNGLQEVFTFDHIGPKWRLVSYEDWSM